MTSRGNLYSHNSETRYEPQGSSMCHRQSSHEMCYTSESHRSRWRRPRKKKKQTQRQVSASFAHSQNSHLESGSSTGSQESDIPGYYYDAEKKTYFKILPNTMTSVGSFVTKETIKKKEAEKQRLSDLQTVTRKIVPISASSPVPFRKRLDSHLINVLRNMQCGQGTCRNLQTSMIHNTCLSIQHDFGSKNCCPNQPGMQLEDIQRMEISQNREKLVCVTSLKSCLAQCIQLMTIKEQFCSDRKDKNRRVLRVIPPDVAVGPIYKKVSSLCWAPLPSLPGNHTVLYTTMCPIGCYSSIVCISNLDAASSDTMKLFEFDLGVKTVWSSAWSSQHCRFSVGAERICHLVDVTTRRKWTYATYNSDPLSQLFSSTNANVMYNGTRGGLVLTHDIRTPGKHHPQATMKQGEGVGCLRVMQDENYILASDFSGMIYTWDQRMRKKMIKYTGLVNSHYQLPFHFDETETVICSSGSDSYTKLWDVRSGELLRSLPPSHAASLESFPLSFYSNCWGDVYGNCAVLVATRNRFEFYR